MVGQIGWRLADEPEDGLHPLAVSTMDAMLASSTRQNQMENRSDPEQRQNF